MKTASRYLFLFCALFLFSHPGIVPAAEDSFFIIESPAGLGGGVEIWERLEVGGKEYEVVSGRPSRGVASIDIGPLDRDQALFVVSARRGIDLPLISKYGTVLLSDGRVARTSGGGGDGTETGNASLRPRTVRGGPPAGT